MRGNLRSGVFVWGVFTIATFAATSPAFADLIAYCDFNDSNLIVDQGAGSLATNFPAVDVSYSAGTTNNARTGVPAGQSLTLRNQANNGTGHADFTISTAGYMGVVLSLATQKTATGFSNNQIAYSTDGGATFTSFGAPYNPPTAFDQLTFDFSAISALNNNPDSVFRISFAGATSATGNNRMDNVQFQGMPGSVAVPEPPFGLLGCAVAGAFVRRWRAIVKRWMASLMPWKSCSA